MKFVSTRGGCGAVSFEKAVGPSQCRSKNKTKLPRDGADAMCAPRAIAASCREDTNKKIKIKQVRGTRPTVDYSSRSRCRRSRPRCCALGASSTTHRSPLRSFGRSSRARLIATLSNPFSRRKQKQRPEPHEHVPFARPKRLSTNFDRGARTEPRPLRKRHTHTHTHTHTIHREVLRAATPRELAGATPGSRTRRKRCA